MLNRVCRAFLGLTCATILFISSAWAADAVRIELPDGRTAVVAQGALEAASIGSYSVAVFEGDDLLTFVAGTIQPRDGSIFADDGTARVEFVDIDGNGSADMIVTQLTAGSGDSVVVDALALGAHHVALMARIQSTASADNVGELKRMCGNGQCASVPAK